MRLWFKSSKRQVNLTQSWWTAETATATAAPQCLAHETRVGLLVGSLQLYVNFSHGLERESNAVELPPVFGLLLVPDRIQIAGLQLVIKIHGTGGAGTQFLLQTR